MLKATKPVICSQNWLSSLPAVTARTVSPRAHNLCFVSFFLAPLLSRPFYHQHPLPHLLSYGDFHEEQVIHWGEKVPNSQITFFRFK